MPNRIRRLAPWFVLAQMIVIGSCAGAAEPQFPDLPKTATSGTSLETAVFAGGCFWGVEAVFESLQGVTEAVSGYSGGKADAAIYEVVSSGATGHAESVRVTYDPRLISYGTLLKVFFSVAHDPTQLNYQGPDHGTQYRSAIFYANPAQKAAAEEYVKLLTQAKLFRSTIVTQIVPLAAFYPAEDYHQDFMKNHPDHPYIMAWDKPKISHLVRAYPELVKKS